MRYTWSMRLAVFLISISTSMGEASIGGGFNRTSGMIDIPTADVLEHGIFEVGASTTLMPDDGRLRFSSRDDDARLNIGLFNRMELGLTLFRLSNGHDVDGNLQVKLWEEKDKWPAISIGLQNIVQERRSPCGRGWDHNSLYVVASKDLGFLEGIRGHLGIGGGRFVGHGERSEHLCGLFFGAEKGFTLNLFKQSIPLDVMAEVDGRDVNLGMRYLLPHGLRMEVALTEVDGLFDKRGAKPLFGLTFSSPSLLAEEEREEAEKTQAKVKIIGEKMALVEKEMRQVGIGLKEALDRAEIAKAEAIKAGSVAEALKRKMADLEARMETVQDRVLQWPGTEAFEMRMSALEKKLPLIEKRFESKIEEALTQAKKAKEETGAIAKDLWSEIEALKAKIEAMEGRLPERLKETLLERRHTVLKGDTLWDIAKKYYRNPRRWPSIYRRNKPKIVDPDLIYPGQIFVIP